jgi:hypothetical protein
MPGLVELLGATEPEHHAHHGGGAARPQRPPRFVVDLPPLAAKRARAKEPQCVHCHTVNDTLHATAVADGSLAADAMWVYPPPRRIGLELDPSDQARVAAVHEGTPAAAAGLRAGDRLLRLGRQASVRTIGDVQWALHVTHSDGAEVELTWQREGEDGPREHEAVLALGAGWKRGTPAEYAWRPYKWNLSPDPGFGGKLLDRDDKRALGLEEDGFALRIGYLIDWGERAHRGRAARAAGLRVGDVVVSFAGRSDFASHDLFQAWVRLTCKVGETVEVVVWRDRARVPLPLTLPP